MPRVSPDGNDVVVWKFDDAGAPFLNSGTLAGSHNLATLSTTTYLGLPNPRLQVQGPFGAGSYAVEFAGSQSGAPRCFIAGANSFQPQPPISMSGWVFLNQYDASYTQHFLQKQHTNGIWGGGTFQTTFFQNRTYVGSSESWEMGFYYGAQGSSNWLGNPQDTTLRIPIGVWNHFGWTFDGNNFAVYMNGDLVRTETVGPPARTIAYDTGISSGPWYTGAIPSGSGAPEEIYAKIADWRFANVVRPKSYFEDLYRAGQLSWTGNATELPALPNGLTRYFKLKATCSGSPSGYIEWVNMTGGLDGAPLCVGIMGPPLIVHSWVN